MVKETVDLDKIINQSETQLKEKTELGEVMDSLDKDKLDKDTNMSSIDTNTRLSGSQISSILIFDELQRMGIFSKTCSISRQLKRLAISKNGMGRQEKVEIVKGERMQNNAGGFGQKLMGLFSKRE